jgi:hypothetical protein
MRKISFRMLVVRSPRAARPYRFLAIDVDHCLVGRGPSSDMASIDLLETQTDMFSWVYGKSQPKDPDPALLRAWNDTRVKTVLGARVVSRSSGEFVLNGKGELVSTKYVGRAAGKGGAYPRKCSGKHKGGAS